MKKIIRIALITSLILVCILVFSSCKIDFLHTGPLGLEYEIIHGSDTHVIITGIGTCTNTNLIIPSTLDGYKVTKIQTGAFANCDHLKSITIPDSVTSIGSYPFMKCSNLTSIAVAEGNPKYHSSGNCLIETESKTLIAGCPSSVIPTDGSVTRIGNNAFRGCDSLTSITIQIGRASCRERVS